MIKINEIGSIIKMGDFNEMSRLWQGGRGSLEWDVFTTDKGGGKFLRKFSEFTKNETSGLEWIKFNTDYTKVNYTNITTIYNDKNRKYLQQLSKCLAEGLGADT